ncbi:MAG: type I DNA topoisomerase [Crocinitomicaceae bacterium]|jgi:DNA topoisomerase I|nr:type I DNA topoisomerase [Crocinitomicaceae bacterium]MDP4723938.1 type I DNA topoisomerase [Crocinitomicaceae bacterium]MDP4740160.1 type I DNA topoisomerase [Crocinitomicaceae bacterium]MDP4800004.1 type I DNA topoisomerase [Crocinitomicaceae bacterium]MDP4806938.1 type I DNA topoisomerase [Crocinitomicaceae bacterium]
MAKNLVIVESPAKAKTIEGYLGKDYIVKSSYGHVRDLAKKGIAIDIDAHFAPQYEVSPDKKQIVAELKKLAKAADTVWLATDEDREGEAISWHLYETLDLKKKDTKRITFNEITKTAVTRAIENPRQINQELVDAQQARRVLDRIVGFELSPVLWKKVRPSLSAGRVQSVAVRLIVEREREINQFNTEGFYRVQGQFLSENGVLNAELNQQLSDKKAALQLLTEAQTAKFTVEDVQQKPATKSPAAPFTTSTLQQEASLKLGFSVSKTMSVAQRLYEAGHITYMRTDSVNLSQTAIDAAKSAIISAYGEAYSKPTKYSTKSAGAQEAHEAIRPTDFTRPNIQAERDEERLYELIWKRGIASQMTHAQLERTTIKIKGLSSPYYFQAKGEVLIFDGFLKVYLAASLDDELEENNETEGLLPKVTAGAALTLQQSTATERFSRPPSRYVEASLVKKLEELGIGRPSTYAPTISTIQKRNYVEKQEREGAIRKYAQLVLDPNGIQELEKSETTGKEKNKLSPTDIGIVVTDFLVENFEQILDYQFTAKVEASFDEIANGQLNWTDMLQSFYGPFHSTVENTLEHSERATGERELGTDPKSGRKIIARIGRFGPMIQIGDEKSDGLKPQFASLQGNQSINNITLEEALKLFEMPKVLGEHNGEVVRVNIGRFGPYVQVGKRFSSIPKEEDPMSMSFERAIELDALKQEEAAKALIKTFDENPDVQLLNGRYGAYLKIGKDNFKLPKDCKPETLSLAECMEIAANQPAKSAKKRPIRKK